MRLSHVQPGSGPVKLRRDEDGYVLVMFALLLVPMLLMAGFAVDVGNWYNRASDLRKASDAAALAGVVWLPNVGAAEIAALAAAERNGFPDGGAIEVRVVAASESRIKVTITDNRVESYLWGSLGGRDISLTRTAYAVYNLPVPLGSPRNFIGTGLLLEAAGTGYENEELYMSVNPYCTDKVNGDRYQSMSGPGGGGDRCSGATNTEYRSRGYETIIQAPPGRSSAIEVLLYDPRYNWDDDTGVVTTVCNTVLEWSNWTEVPSSGPRNFTIPPPGPGQFSRWTNGGWWGGGSWSNPSPLDPGYYPNAGAGQYRYRYRVEKEVCGTNEISEDSIDSRLVNPPGDVTAARSERYTYVLYNQGENLLDPTDDVEVCRRSFEWDTEFDYGPYLGSVRWNKLCEIPVGARSGDYVLRVTNQGNSSKTQANGANNYGVVARYTGSAGHGLCDGRTDDMCPRVHGRDALSVMAASAATTAQFFLAEIEPQHAGKVLRITLFDPGEGGQYLRIKRPTATNSWADVTFDWESAGVGSGTTSNLAVRVSGNDRFNGKVLTIDVPLTGYDPPDDNYWWKIEYQFGGTVSDRTTWEAKVIGDPVHLVEDTPD